LRSVYWCIADSLCSLGVLWRLTHLERPSTASASHLWLFLQDFWLLLLAPHQLVVLRTTISHAITDCASRELAPIAEKSLEVALKLIRAALGLELHEGAVVAEPSRGPERFAKP
jgi:hypothetical protein